MTFLVFWKGLIALVGAFVALTTVVKNQEAAKASQLDTDADAAALKAQTDITEAEMQADAKAIQQISSQS